MKEDTEAARGRVNCVERLSTGEEVREARRGGGRECWGHSTDLAQICPQLHLMILHEANSGLQGRPWGYSYLFIPRHKVTHQVLGRGGSRTEPPVGSRIVLLPLTSHPGTLEVGVFPFVKVKALVVQSCLTLCDPMDCGLPGSSVRGILQARILEWVSISSSKGSS